jgi:hypothetical protein
MSELSCGSLTEDQLLDPKALGQTRFDVFTKNSSLLEVISGGPPGIAPRDVVRDFWQQAQHLTGGGFLQPVSGSGALLYFLGARLQTLMDQGADGTLFSQDVAVNRFKWGLYSWLMGLETREVGALAGTAITETDVFRLGVNSPHLAWLSDVAADQIVELRRQHPVQEIREDFRVGRCQIRSAPFDRLDLAVDQAGKYLSSQLDKHAEALRRLRGRRPWRLGASVAAGAVSTGIAIVATVYPPLAIPGAIASILASKSLYDVWKSNREDVRKLLLQEKRPLGVLVGLRDSALPYGGTETRSGAT